MVLKNRVEFKCFNQVACILTIEKARHLSDTRTFCMNDQRNCQRNEWQQPSVNVVQYKPTAFLDLPPVEATEKNETLK